MICKSSLKAHYALINILFLLLHINTSGQKLTDYQWEGEGSYTIVPDTFKSRDVIIIEENVDLEYTYNRKDLKLSNTISTRKKVKILTKAGVLKYSEIYLPSKGILLADARTIKPNGEVIDLKASDIKSLKKTSVKDSGESPFQYQFSVPGLEAGDEIEFIFKGENQYKEKQPVFLNSNAYLLNKKLNVIIPAELELFLIKNNDFPEPQKTNEENKIIYSWSVQNLEQITEQTNSIPTIDLPFIRLDFKSVTLGSNPYRPAGTYQIHQYTWDDFVDQIIYRTEVVSYHGRPKAQYYLKFLENHLENKTMAGKTELEKFLVIHNYIRDSISVEKLDRNESYNPIGYHFYNRKIDWRNLMMAYSQLFEKLGINFYVGFAFDKYEGLFDPGFISPENFTDNFLAFDIKGQTYFFFLKNRWNDYALGEVPYRFQGTKAILISRMPQKERLKLIEFPETETDDNNFRSTIMTKVSGNEMNFTYESRNTYSGAYSLAYRSLLRTIKLTSDSILSDTTIFKGKNLDSISVSGPDYLPPYNTTLYLRGSGKLNPISLDSNVFLLKLSDLAKVTRQHLENQERTLDYHTPFRFTYNFKHYISFDKEIELITDKSTGGSCINDYGESTIKVIKVNPGTILIEVKYRINKSVLKKQDIKQLIDLNEIMEKINDQSITIKV